MFLLWYFSVRACFVFSCCVTTRDEKLSLVRVFAQTGICLMERHAPVVFTNWVALILTAELQLRRMSCYHTSGWLGGGPKPCTFPPGSWTNGKGLWKFLSGRALSRGIFFFPLLLLLGLLSGWLKGGWGTKRSPWARMLLFSGAADDTLLSDRGRICWAWGQRFVWTPATCMGPATFLSTLYFWIWPFDLITPTPYIVV